VTRDALILESLVSTKLESLRLVEGVIGISLSVQKLTPSTAHTPDLFSATAGASLPLPRLLERLQNKLGKNNVPGASFVKANKFPDDSFAKANNLDVAAVQTLHWQHEHRPELASRSQPLNAQALIAKLGKSAALSGDTQTMPARPFWLISPEEIAASAFAILSGPERIESGWWDSAHLGDVRRDYYVAQLHSGTRIWIFQPRPHGHNTAAIIWYLHGYF
jgi:protein ImuB